MSYFQTATHFGQVRRPSAQRTPPLSSARRARVPTPLSPTASAVLLRGGDHDLHVALAANRAGHDDADHAWARQGAARPRRLDAQLRRRCAASHVTVARAACAHFNSAPCALLSASALRRVQGCWMSSRRSRSRSTRRSTRSCSAPSSSLGRPPRAARSAPSSSPSSFSSLPSSCSDARRSAGERRVWRAWRARAACRRVRCWMYLLRACATARASSFHHPHFPPPSSPSTIPARPPSTPRAPAPLQLLELQFPLRSIALVSGAFFSDAQMAHQADNKGGLSSNARPTHSCPTPTRLPEPAASYPTPPPLTGGYARVQQQAPRPGGSGGGASDRGRPRDPVKAGFTKLR